MIYNYLFFKCYLFFKNQKYRKNPVSKASGIIGGLLLLNIYTVLSVLKKYFFDYTISTFLFISIIILTIIITNLFFNKKKIVRITKQYSACTRQQLLVKKMMSSLYIVISIAMFFIFMSNLTK